MPGIAAPVSDLTISQAAHITEASGMYALFVQLKCTFMKVLKRH
jgi:hypothetical protein